jgi:hypothetical protein
MTKEEVYQSYMDELAIKVSQTLDGVPLHDVCPVLARLLGHALAESYGTDRQKREEMLEAAIDLIKHDWEIVDFGEGKLNG